MDKCQQSYVGVVKQIEYQQTLSGVKQHILHRFLAMHLLFLLVLLNFQVLSFQRVGIFWIAFCQQVLELRQRISAQFVHPYLPKTCSIFNGQSHLLSLIIKAPTLVHSHHQLNGFIRENIISQLYEEVV